MRRILFVVFLLTAGSTLLAQEAVVGLYANPHVRPQPASLQQRQRAAAAPLPLPFVDDFAEKSPYPNPAKWESKGVFVNTNYGIRPPTIGVATFDAQGADGHVYPHIGTSPDGADTLTGLAIGLQGASGVVLSFFYQPAGIGDMPEYDDLLKLEFFAPQDNEWRSAWSASANERDSLLTETYYLSDSETTVTYKEDSLNTKFRYVAIAIDEPEFLLDGFRFRFVNLAGLAASPVPGRESNCDHWHLDFVYLNGNRTLTDTLLPDVAICEPQQSLALAYSSIPAAHLAGTDAQQQLFGNPMEFTLTYQNFGWGTRNITRRFAVTPLMGSVSFPEEYLGGSENILSGQKFVREYTFDPYDFTATADSAAFEVKSYLITDTDTDPFRTALRHNDTTSYIQRFYNYYSYDDGTAENGYGLYGTGTANGSVAVKYTSYITDSLRAVNLYFNMARDSANAKAFRITVWGDNNGVPGAVLYSQRVDAPAFSDELNKFVTYKLPHTLEIGKGQTFYVGWTQLSETFLNVGYDANTTRSGINFYSIGNVWQPSIYEGALMIRPVFGTAAQIPDDAIELVTNAASKKEETLLIYPNPARDVVNLRNETKDGEKTIPPALRIEIYDFNGQLLQNTVTTNGSFSVQGMSDGLYILRIYENNRFKTTRKLLIAR